MWLSLQGIECISCLFVSDDLRQVFCGAGALNEWKDFASVCGRVLVLNMCVEVGTGTRLVFASGARQPFDDVDGTTVGRGFGLETKGDEVSHTSK
jgi:hypothetical protein